MKSSKIANTTPRDGATTSVSQQNEVLEVLRPVLAAGKEREALVRVQSIIRNYQGPIPPASEIAAYEAVQKGAADRILAMAENEQVNSFQLSHSLITGERNLRLGGLIGATLLALALLGVTVTALLLHEPWVAGIIGSGTVVAVVALFLGQDAKFKNGSTEIQVGGAVEE